MDINHHLEILKKNVIFAGLVPEDLSLESFSSEKNVKFSIFKKILLLSKNFDFNELLTDLNASNHPKKNTETIFLENANKLITYCSGQSVNYTEIKLKLEKMKYELEAINDVLSFEMISLQDFDDIKNSFFENDPLISVLFFELSHLNLGDICKVKQEISIEEKVFNF